MAGREPTYSIGELAEDFAVTPRSLRFYEDQGLLSPARCGSSRIYSHRDRGRLALICRGKRLGFSIAEIKEFLELYEADDHQVEQMRYVATRARSRIDSLERQLADVQQTLAELRALAATVETHLQSHGVTETPDRRSP
ncbi:MAG: MerR family transcriptional regulator [Azospirillum sp.]|nr:MerR family transcriptional regulator [Azospirillum sp.]